MSSTPGRQAVSFSASARKAKTSAAGRSTTTSLVASTRRTRAGGAVFGDPHLGADPRRSGLARHIAEQRPRDHEPLDLARALVDLGDLGVPVVALGGELLRVAVAAEHLDRLAGLAARDRAGEELGLRALDRVWPARLLEPRRPPHERTRRLDLG